MGGYGHKESTPVSGSSLPKGFPVVRNPVVVLYQSWKRDTCRDSREGDERYPPVPAVSNRLPRHRFRLNVDWA